MIQVAVLHRDRLTREALRRSLQRSRFELLWAVDSVAALQQSIGSQPPQLLLAELALLGPQACHLPSLLGHGCGVIGLAAAGSIGDAFEALSGGVLGMIEPPTIGDDGELCGAEQLLTRLQRLSTLVATPARPPAPPTLASGGALPPLLALGASTGGPQALATVLASLPAGFAGAVLIVQHIEDEFTDGLANWLATHCRLPVQLAVAGQAPRAGQVYIAAPGAHLSLDAARHFARPRPAAGELHVPSVDALFLSLARHAAPGVAALLTGMGSDGVAGLVQLRRAGWYTVAQDEPSSIVYGMPRAAAEQGGATHSLPLPAIGPALLRHLTGRTAR